MFLISNQQLPSGMASGNDMGSVSDSAMKTSRKQKQNKKRLQLPGAYGHQGYEVFNCTTPG